jgi:hypothetical protein
MIAASQTPVSVVVQEIVQQSFGCASRSLCRRWLSTQRESLVEKRSFEVADIESVSAAALELAAKGYAPLNDARTEPWAQTVARVQTAEGVIVGISYAPWMHGDAAAPRP